MAQIAHETHGFARLDENTNYCNPVFGNNGMLSSLDVKEAQLVCGKP